VEITVWRKPPRARAVGTNVVGPALKLAEANDAA